MVKKFGWAIGTALRSAPLYVAAFCLLFPLSLFNLYSDYYGWHSLIPASILLLLLALLIFRVSDRILSDSHLAGVVALTSLIALFPRSFITLPIFALLAFAGIACVVFRFLTRRSEGAPLLAARFTWIANAIAVAVLFAVSAPAAFGHFENSRQAERITAERFASLRQQLPEGTPRTLPHIVHIVLDGYSRADVLLNTYGFDNSPFLDALRQRGFRIAERAGTPFNQTLFVMSSIFSLGPLAEHQSMPAPGENNAYRNMLISVMRNGVVPQMLRKLGYDFRSTPEAFSAVQITTPVASDGHRPPLGNFAFPTTYVFTYDMLVRSPALAWSAKRLLGSFFEVVAVNYRHLLDVPDRRFEPTDGRPLFIYQHILAPHPPFNITPEGEPRSLEGFPLILADNSAIIGRSERKREEYRRGYSDKLRYINDAILRQIDKLKASLPGPMIIVLHGDHGGGLHHEQNHKVETCLAERFSPLLAVYATDPDVLSQFSDDFNLVNLYRAIFRATLNADLRDLPDKRTFISWKLDEVAPVQSEELAEPCPAPSVSMERVASP